MSNPEIIGYVILALVTILGLYSTISKPILNNQKTMIELTCAVKELTDKLIDLEKNNTDSHRRIHHKLEDHQRELEDHELRIHDLEVMKDGFK